VVAPPPAWLVNAAKSIFLHGLFAELHHLVKRVIQPADMSVIHLVARRTVSDFLQHAYDAAKERK